VYSDTLTVSGGQSPYAWTVSSGSLPAGISLSADGVLTGQPTATGTFAFTVKAADAKAQSATQALSITVAQGVTATFAPPPAATLATPYSYTLTATGGTTPYAWSVNAGSLPPGITLSSDGVLSGTPTLAGSYPFTVNVIDANKGIATTSITLTVAAGLLRMTAPSAVALPSVAPGGTTSAKLGTVTVTDARGLTGATWTATVSATAPATGTKTPAQTIPLGGVTYRSGPATATTGTGTFTPGQATASLAVNLTAIRTAFTLAGGSPANSASWTPTVSVTVPSSAVGGAYVATITESVS
jgi:Putative Ig domain